MNTALLELYKLAQVPQTAIDPSNNMPYETTCFSADMFAKLIIEECVKVGRDAWLTDNSTVPTFPLKQIKHHFGVN